MFNNEVLAIEYARNRQQELMRERDVDRMVATLQENKQQKLGRVARIFKPRAR